MKIQLAKAAQQREAEAKKRRDMARRAAQIEEQRQQDLVESRPQQVATAANQTKGALKAANRNVGLRAKLRNRASLRELFVLKELLEPPVTMRGPRS